MCILLHRLRPASTTGAIARRRQLMPYSYVWGQALRGDQTSTGMEQEEVDVPPRSTGPSHEPPGLVVLAELAAVYPVAGKLKRGYCRVRDVIPYTKNAVASTGKVRYSCTHSCSHVSTFDPTPLVLATGRLSATTSGALVL